MSGVIPGTCRHCRCTERDACLLATGDPCCWTDRERTVCSAPSCIVAEERRIRSLRNVKPVKKRSRFHGWGYGAIQEQLRRERRRRRKRAA
jgi:hypothetical protein